MATPALSAMQLGPYRLQEKLGAGAMGTVYLAEADEGPVALKVIHPHLLERQGYFKRFQREAEAGRRVDHPRVVRTLDSDLLIVEGEPYFFLVMEYVQGRTLRELLREQGSVPEALAREIGLQVAAGLAAIHEAGIVHRDVKPENVLLTDDHRVRIMDLGVARLEGAATELTAEGHFAGSLLYAAPEQFRREPIGSAADLYALGVLLYELTAGTNPFRHDRAAAVMKAHLEEVPPPLDKQDAEVSLFFAEVVRTLLAKRPSDRFISAMRVHAVLQEGERSAWWAERQGVARQRVSRLPRVPVRRDTKLYGRETELELIRQCWARARDGRGHVLWLDGEAGIGKTRLVDAGLHEIEDQDARVLYGSYPPAGGLGGISDAVLSHFGTEGLEDALRPYLVVTPTLVPAFAALLRRAAPPPEAAQLQGDALHAVCCHLMQALASEKPLLWVIEDLHFADADSRQLVLSLARAVAGHAVLLLLTTRPGIAEHELAHFRRLENLQRAGLGRLSAREVVLLLQDAFRSEALADRLGVRIALKSDGVPFFVFEMIRGLKEGQFITELPDGSYVETKEVERIEVPSVVRDLIEARLSGLAREDRALLDVGAVQGFEFDPDLVARALKRPRVAVLQALAEIDRRSGVVRAAGARYRFDHHQIQEVVYEDLSEGLRQEYHGLLATALAAREAAGEVAPEELPGETAYQLASHYIRSYDAREALPFLEPALGHLAKAYRNEALLDLARRVLEETDVLDGALRVRVLLQLVEALHHVARMEEAAEYLEEASHVADDVGEARLRVRAQMAWGRHFDVSALHNESLAARAAALELAREAQDEEGEAQLTMAIASSHFNLGRHEEAGQRYLEAISRCRVVGDVDTEAGATINYGLVLLVRGRLDDAALHFERGAALARQSGNRLWEANAHGNMGIVWRRRGRLDEARESIEQRLQICREIGFRKGEATGMGPLARVLSAQGKFEEGCRALEQALSGARQIGDRWAEHVASQNLSSALYSLGRYASALGHAERAFEIARALGIRQAEAYPERDVGGIWSALGRPERARGHLERAVRLAREFDDPRQLAGTLRVLAGHHRGLGEMERALRLYREAVNVERPIGEASELAGVLLDLGESLFEAGQVDEARSLLEEAQTLAQQAGDAIGTVLATCQLARFPGGDVAAATASFEEHAARLPPTTTKWVHQVLWKATGDRRHLDAAHRLLCEIREHAPEDCRETLIENVPVHREIVSAWKALHPERA